MVRRVYRRRALHGDDDLQPDGHSSVRHYFSAIYSDDGNFGNGQRHDWAHFFRFEPELWFQLPELRSWQRCDADGYPEHWLHFCKLDWV
jgi:hypothetical protein